MNRSERDMLGDARPIRVVRTDHAWALEVERLERVTRGIYRPTLRRLVGKDSVDHLLATSQLDPEVIEAIQALMARDDVPEGRGFVLTEAGVAPETDASEVRHEDDRVGPLERRVNALDLENRQMARRLQELERRLGQALAGGGAHTGGRAPEPRARRSADFGMDSGMDPGSEGPRVSADAPSGPAEPLRLPDEPAAPAPVAGRAEPAADGESDDRPAPRASAEAHSVEDAPADAPAPEDAPGEEQGEPKLTLPTAKDYAKELGVLLGAKVPMREDAAQPSLEEGRFYASRLLDDGGDVVGALVADATAAIHLGGALIMLSQGALDDMAKEGEPSDDVVEAMSELFNVQSRTFNETEGNPHVKTDVMTAVVLDGMHAFLRHPRARRDLIDPHGGRTILISC